MGNKTKTIIALHGSYYGHNFGDILLIRLFNDWIKEYSKNVEVELPFASDESTRYIGADSNKGFETLKKADVLIYSGGGYFGEPHEGKMKWGFRNLKRHFPAAGYMRVNRKPYAIIGVGVGPITNPITRKALIWICKGAEVLAVRDVESKKYLMKYGVKEAKINVTADAVLSMRLEEHSENKELTLENFKKENHLSGLLGIHLTVKDNPQLIKLAKDIADFSNMHPNLGVVIFNDVKNGKVDIAGLKKIVNNKVIEVPYEDPDSLINLLKELDLIITNKLHVGITAKTLGKIVIAISGHSKTIRFYKQIGEEDKCIPLEVYKKGEILPLLDNLVSRGFPKKYPPESLVKKSKENKEFLYKFLKNNLR